jgi:Ca2+-transporting ATPase
MWQFPNRAMRWVVLGAAAFLSVALYVPPVQSLFRFSMLHPTDVMLCLSAGVFSIVWFEILKMIRRPHGADGASRLRTVGKT